ncbi:hypothetical protein LTR67_008689 [Exophiala xenobiotica]
MLFPTTVSLITSLCISFVGAINPSNANEISHGSDLLSFITRPEIRAPRWNVTKHHPDLITPGYWFVGPYTNWATVPERSEYLPFQVGPHIYDGNGDLVWSGAGLAHNRNAFDFRTFEANGSSHLSYVLHYSERPDDEEQHGLGVYLDSSFRRKGRVTHDIGIEFNFHEFDLRNDGKTALYIFTDRPVKKDPISGKSGWVSHDCLSELDMVTNTNKFYWCPLDHGVTLNETYHQIPDMSSITEGGPWDFFHANSIDKFGDGDYLYSGRHANTVYRVNHSDSSIVWRLGGKISDFSMDFNFSSQHHATIHSESGSTVILTLLDNAADDQERQPNTAKTSSAKMVELDTETMTAKLLNEWYRPDGKISDKRGNVNMMPNGNVFVAWSDSGYMTEHTSTPDKKLVLEASFASSRFSTYRAYKSNFTGTPIEPPAMKAFGIQSDSDSSYAMTSFYISWNGATEVRSWKFYGAQNRTHQESFECIGTANRTGFETTFSEKGTWKYVYAQALAANGSTLAKSNVERTSVWPGSSAKTKTQPTTGTQGSSGIASTVKSQLKHMSSAAVAGWVFLIMLMLQVAVIVFLYRYPRRPRFSREGDQVELLSKTEYAD